MALIRPFMQAAGVFRTFKEIPVFHRRYVTTMGFAIPRFEFANLEEAQQKKIQKSVVSILKSTPLESNPRITYYQLMHIIPKLMGYFAGIEKHYLWAKVAVDKLAALHKQEWGRLWSLIYIVSIAEMETSTLISVGMRYADHGVAIEIKGQDSEDRTFKVNGIERESMRLGLPDKSWGFAWTTCPYNGKEYPVYIQRHAIRRTYERTPFDLQFSMELTFQDPKPFRYNGTILIPMEMGKMVQSGKATVGYFVAEIVDDAMLLTTFLFVTMDGTPEGDKMRKKLKADKRVKEILKLDELNTYMRSDIRNDPLLRKLLEDCGVGYLFDIKPANPPEALEERSRMFRIYFGLGLNQDRTSAPEPSLQ